MDITVKKDTQTHALDMEANTTELIQDYQLTILLNAHGTHHI